MSSPDAKRNVIGRSTDNLSKAIDIIDQPEIPSPTGC
jgi:hypothetical protein